MSRVGKQPVFLPEGINVDIVNNTILIKGKKGELKNSYPESIKVVKEDNKILVSPKEASKNSKELDSSIQELSIIVGQKPTVNRASKSVAGFKIRDGMPIGTSVTSVSYTHLTLPTILLV